MFTLWLVSTTRTESKLQYRWCKRRPSVVRTIYISKLDWIFYRSNCINLTMAKIRRLRMKNPLPVIEMFEFSTWDSRASFAMWIFSSHTVQKKIFSKYFNKSMFCHSEKMKQIKQLAANIGSKIKFTWTWQRWHAFRSSEFPIKIFIPIEIVSVKWMAKLTDDRICSAFVLWLT